MPKKTNLDNSILLEDDPQFVQFTKSFGLYFYRPIPGFPLPNRPLRPEDAS